MKTIVKMIFGSHLYGTHTEQSDRDYKGVFLPSFSDCILNRIPKSVNHHTKSGSGKNTADDVDEEMYSLQYFMRLAVNGEMIVIDMLHAPMLAIIETSETWELLHDNRARFYSKNLSGYLGYIRKQTAKYSVKGSRLNAMEELLAVLSKYDESEKLVSAWSTLPINDYCSMVENPKENRWRHYQCCGKQLQETMRIAYAKEIIQNTHDRYGARAELAKQNEGIDWKAVSHAFRAGLQLKEIYETGDLKYPLRDAKFIRDVKTGVYHYVNDGIGDKLDTMLCEVEELAAKSTLPERVDSKWVDTFVLERYAGAHVLCEERPGEHCGSAIYNSQHAQANIKTIGYALNR